MWDDLRIRLVLRDKDNPIEGIDSKYESDW